MQRQNSQPTKGSAKVGGGGGGNINSNGSSNNGDDRNATVRQQLNGEGDRRRWMVQQQHDSNIGNERRDGNATAMECDNDNDGWRDGDRDGEGDGDGDIRSQTMSLTTFLLCEFVLLICTMGLLIRF